jgi:hypothetical protein
LTWLFLGDFAKARFYAEQAVAIRVPDLHTYADVWPDDLQSASFLFYSWVLIVVGYLDQAVAWRDRGVALARERRHANSLILVLTQSLADDFLLGTDPVISLVRAEEHAALCAEHGQPFWGTIGDFQRGCCLVAIGRTEDRAQPCRQGVAPDKWSSTADEWKLLLENMMMASLTVTAAESGLWNPLKESFAGRQSRLRRKSIPTPGRRSKRSSLKEQRTRRPDAVEAAVETASAIGDHQLRRVERMASHWASSFGFGRTPKL